MSHPTPGGTFAIGSRTLSRLGYGMGSIVRAVGNGLDRDDAVALLRRAADLGIQHYDTAEFYGAGEANRLLRDAFTDRRDDVFYATKVGTKPVDGTPPLAAAQKPHELRESVEANLRSLGTDRIDLAYLRRMDEGPGMQAFGDQIVDIDEQLDELENLRIEGKIGAIGLSHVSMEQLRHALPVGIAAVSNVYSLVQRSDENMLTLCRERDIAWSPYFPLGGGWGRTEVPRVQDEPEVKRIADAHDTTPTAVGLAWLLEHSPNTFIITGTGSIQHLEDNVRAADLELTGDEMAALDRIGV